MWKEFKAFAVKGNVIDLAVGVMLGAAFGKIVTSIVNDIVMPPIGWLLGQVRFDDLFIALNGKRYETLEEAAADAAPTINYGLFLNTVLDFLIVAFTIFLVVRQINKLRKFRQKEAPAPTEKTCPECLSLVPIAAKRCKHCTSVLQVGEA
ncbi:large-conductance mechanosensitive channel protein MscL [Paenibacillus sp.]|uniref:large-conductance mechanosensitive channel protein MscL n=1 Tax=Paenibacillus sp. TaxID=58172 RepID=UPI002D2B4CC5|nr:large-conductance mechanosensitive channel protein MscL [Paenibacillus sp.]HZG57157.1 large-conductance mechanosensitive channel protein MscL [Paenibacillus sp.]